MVRFNITLDNLKHRYVDLQQSSYDIAKEYNCSRVTITKLLKKHNIAIRNSKQAHQTNIYIKKFAIEIPENELRVKYLDNLIGIQPIAKYYSCSCNCVRNNLYRYNIKIRTRKEAQLTPTCVNGRAKAVEWAHSNIGRETNRAAQLKRYTNPDERIKTGKIMHKYHLDHPDFSKKQSGILLEIKKNPIIEEKRLINSRKSWDKEGRREKAQEHFKSLWRNPEYKARQIKWRKEFWASNSPEFIELRKKMIAGLNLRPNKPETIVLNILETLYKGDWKYTGDGQVIIGGLNPDFTNINGKKQLIEVFGDYWHTQKLKPYRINEGRVITYANYGYKTLIIWEHEAKDVAMLSLKIKEFCDAR